MLYLILIFLVIMLFILLIHLGYEPIKFKIVTNGKIFKIQGWKWFYWDFEKEPSMSGSGWYDIEFSSKEDAIKKMNKLREYRLSKRIRWRDA